MAVNYGVLRVKKLKTAGAVRGAAKHNLRETQPHNADPERQYLNKIAAAKSSGEVLHKLKEKLSYVTEKTGRKIRKDATVGIEVLITHSPNCDLNDHEYFKASLKFVLDRFGNDNVLNIAIHRDEKTPHMHVLLVPVKNDRLSAKALLGGPKELARLQDDFHEAVSSHFGLERGIRGSRAHHRTIKQFYNDLRAGLETPIPELTKKDVTALLAGRKPDALKEIESRLNAAETEVASLTQRLAAVQENSSQKAAQKLSEEKDSALAENAQLRAEYEATATALQTAKQQVERFKNDARQERKTSGTRVRKRDDDGQPSAIRKRERGSDRGRN